MGRGGGEGRRGRGEGERERRGGEEDSLPHDKIPDTPEEIRDVGSWGVPYATVCTWEEREIREGPQMYICLVCIKERRRS